MQDTGDESAYISLDLVSGLNLKPQRVERRVIEQMYGTVCRDIEMYQCQN